MVKEIKIGRSDGGFTQKYFLPVFFVFFLFLLTGQNAPADVSSGTPMGALNAEIRLERDVYEVGEPVDGKVFITNTFPASVPAIFNIQLFHDGKLISDFMTSIKSVALGTTEFPFMAFGIPQFNRIPEDTGNWRIAIAQQNTDRSRTTNVIIKIIAAKEK